MHQQDNVRPHIAGMVQTFLDKENFPLLPWSASSLKHSPIETVSILRCITSVTAAVGDCSKV